MTYTSSKSILLYHLHIGIWTLVQLNIMWFSSNSVKLMNSIQLSPVSGVWCGCSVWCPGQTITDMFHCSPQSPSQILDITLPHNSLWTLPTQYYTISR